MSKNILTGLLLDEDSSLTLSDLSHACCVQTEWIIELVDEGILMPDGNESSHWRFSGPSLHRAQTVLHLQQDLEINIAGAALALELMDEIEVLRTRLYVLERSD